MNLADRGLNTQAQAIEDAQTQIRIVVRNGWLRRFPKMQINEQVQKIIKKALAQIKIPALRDAAYRSLNGFAERQYNTYLQRLGNDSTLLSALLLLTNTGASAALKRSDISFETDAKGIPMQEYAKTYLEKRVQPVITEL